MRVSYLSNLAGNNSVKELTRMEENVLRYVSGYVCRRVNEKLSTTSGDVDKEEMMLYMIDMSGDEMDGSGTEDWTNLVDRGGLWHVNDMIYEFFVTVEKEVRHVLTVETSTTNRNVKEEMLERVRGSDDVLFNWWLISTEHDQVISSKLFNKVITLYIEIRGFSFASSFVEKYKQHAKKNLQRSRPLRKQLQEPATEANSELPL